MTRRRFALIFYQHGKQLLIVGQNIKAIGLAMVLALLMLVVIGAKTFTAISVTSTSRLAGVLPSWEDDNFDWLNPGPLHGQNGWLLDSGPDVVSPEVISEFGCNILRIDPALGKIITISKDVADQSSGRHTFHVRVKVTGANDASLAKIEVLTTPNAGWDKKFQLFFGSSMRINYSPTAAVNFVNATTMGKWYDIRCELNLDQNLVEVYVDNKLTISSLAIHPGPITLLSLWGWPLDGIVYLDDLHCFPQIPAAVLPAANHQIDFGYYFVDGRYGDYRSEVNDYTDLYYAWARRGYEFDSSDPDGVWLPRMAQALANAVADKKKILLALNLQENDPARVTPLDAVLAVATPYWSSINRIELADEPNWSRAQTEAILQDLRSRLNQRSLAPRPLGVVYTRTQVLTSEAILANGLDWVGIEAYVDPPGSSDSQDNIDNLNAYLTQAKARVPSDKKIVLVMMAYDRNSGWKNIATLTDLQIPTYLFAYNDPRVIAITMFSYGRCGGTRAHPELKTMHRQIWEKIKPVTAVEAEPAMPAKFVVWQNFPNPFNPTTKIQYELPQAGQVSVKIFDLRGNLVRTLVDRRLPAGYHTAIWDAKNAQGQQVASGPYFYRILFGPHQIQKEMTFVK
jgi:hypothetical protein